MTALRNIQHRLTLAVSVTLLAIGLTLLALFGLAAVAIPAVLGILGMELARVARWLRGPIVFGHTRKPIAKDKTA